MGAPRSPFVSRNYQFQSEQPPKLAKMVGFWFVCMFSFGTVIVKEDSGGKSKDEIFKENAGMPNGMQNAFTGGWFSGTVTA